MDGKLSRVVKVKEKLVGLGEFFLVDVGVLDDEPALLLFGS